MVILGAIIEAIIGIVMVVNPEFVYEITQEWKNDGYSGPSKEYILWIRFGGIMFMVVGIGCGLSGLLVGLQ